MCIRDRLCFGLAIGGVACTAAASLCGVLCAAGAYSRLRRICGSVHDVIRCYIREVEKRRSLGFGASSACLPRPKAFLGFDVFAAAVSVPSVRCCLAALAFAPLRDAPAARLLCSGALRAPLAAAPASTSFSFFFFSDMNYGFFPFRSGDPCGAAPPYPPCDGMLRARKKAAQADTASAAVPSWERTRGMPAIRSPLIFCNFIYLMRCGVSVPRM